MTHYSRKRPRSCEDEGCDLMPISKRINDLHIRSGFPEADAAAAAENETEIQSSRQNIQTNSGICDRSKDSYKIGVVDSVQYAYKPELGVADNPYYYHVNEMLFEAHLQRVQRLSRFM